MIASLKATGIAFTTEKGHGVGGQMRASRIARGEDKRPVGRDATTVHEALGCLPTHSTRIGAFFGSRFHSSLELSI